jgi:hypothetical protein
MSRKKNEMMIKLRQKFRRMQAQKVWQPAKVARLER